MSKVKHITVKMENGGNGEVRATLRQKIWVATHFDINGKQGQNASFKTKKEVDAWAVSVLKATGETMKINDLAKEILKNICGFPEIPAMDDVGEWEDSIASVTIMPEAKTWGFAYDASKDELIEAGKLALSMRFEYVKNR